MGATQQMAELLSRLDALTAQKQQLRAEAERQDGLLLLLNTALWMQKLQQYTRRHHGKQPFTVSVSSSPSSSASSLPLTVAVTNCSAVSLCTPPACCLMLLSCDLLHIASATRSRVTFSSPCKTAVFASAASMRMSVVLPLAASPLHYTVHCRVVLRYQLSVSASRPASSASSAAFIPVEHQRSCFSVPLGSFSLDGVDICQAVSISSVPPSLHSTIRTMLRSGIASGDGAGHSEAPIALPSPLDGLFSLSAAESLCSAATPAFFVCFLSPVLCAEAIAASTASAFASSLLLHLLSSPLSTASPPRPGSLEVRWQYLQHSVVMRVEVRQLQQQQEGGSSSSSSAFLVPLVHARSSSAAVLPAVHRHLVQHIAAFIAPSAASSSLASQPAPAVLSSYLSTLAAYTASSPSPPSTASAFCSMLLEQHLLPRSLRDAELLGRLRLCQSELRRLQAVCSDKEALSGVGVQAEEEAVSRCMRKLSSLYAMSRVSAHASSKPTVLEGARLVV